MKEYSVSIVVPVWNEEKNIRPLLDRIASACKNASLDDKKAEKICKKVSAQVRKWAETKRCISSNVIFEQLKTTLRKHDKNAAFMYETHRDIC